jgi:hypothetical protein
MSLLKKSVFTGMLYPAAYLFVVLFSLVLQVPVVCQKDFAQNSPSCLLIKNKLHPL